MIRGTVAAIAAVLALQTPPGPAPYIVAVPVTFAQLVTFAGPVAGLPGTTATPQSIVMTGTGSDPGAHNAYMTASMTMVPVDPQRLAQAVLIPAGRTLVCLATAQVSNNNPTSSVMFGLMDGTTIVNRAHLPAAGGSAVVQVIIHGDGLTHTIQAGFASLQPPPGPAPPAPGAVPGIAVVWNGPWLGGFYPMVRCDLQ